jgi:hypothetical protein
MQTNPPVDPKDLKIYNFYYIRSKVDFTSPPGYNGPLQFQNISMKKEWLGGTWNDRYKETNWETLEDPPKKLALVQNNWYYFKLFNGEGAYFTEPTVEDIRPLRLRIEKYAPVYNLEQDSLYYVRRKSDFESPEYPISSDFKKPLKFLGYKLNNIEQPSIFSFKQINVNQSLRTIDINKDYFYYFLPTANLDDVPSRKELEWPLQYRKRARTYKRKNKRSKSRRN